MEALMQMAIKAAAPTRPHPNPRVGAVVVDVGGIVLSVGAHFGPGQAHAEVVALEQAGERTPGATMFVTLEPCAHRGKTPPCTTALIEAGISRVVVGAVDPDPRVAGKGIEELEAAGIEVEVGLLAAEVHALDPGYFRHRSTGQPAVTLKSAATLDGQVAADDGTSQWITSESTRQDGHALRAAADAVMVGAGTLLADDPG